ncbi:MAG: hypothetical protein RSD64_00840 [Christensenellaceae bacterium]
MSELRTPLVKEKSGYLAAQSINSFVVLFKKVPKTGCRPMATYSVDERRPRCMDSFGDLKADRTKMKRAKRAGK